MERVADNLNGALRTAFAGDPGLYLLGEDVLDPYGGAFKITAGLSTAFPDRVIATPISEGALVGVASGLALSGCRAIVEIMFSDFVALAFDQIINFAAKSVSMYGRPVPMPVVIRCPTGGRRGYGPTHSQSLQKHFIGVPNLSVCEISPFHDNGPLLVGLLERREPTVLFEDKVLYTRPQYRDGVVDDLMVYDLPWSADGAAQVRISDGGEPDCVIIAPGGLTDRVLAAARSLFLEAEICSQVLIPARLYPFDIEPLLPILGSARLICLAEDSAAGGTWGAEVASQIYRALWGRLAHPVLLSTAAASIVPSSAHLERQVIAEAPDIHQAIVRALDA
jgi:pyruvate dehydrogenase E1 component beta subunit